MVQSVLERVLRFGATIATALAGLGSLATAVGFLAERARWNMLGFHSPGVDMNEYLFTGARFLAFLPAVFLTSIPDALWTNPFLLLVLAGIAALFAVLGGEPAQGPAPTRWQRTRRVIRRELPRFRLPALGLLVAGLLLGTAFLLRATTVVDLLFADRIALLGFQCGDPGLGLREHLLLQCEAQLLAHLGQGFLIVLGGIAGLWLLVPGAWRPRSDAPPPGRAEAGLLWLAVLLLILQVMLLPINYGVTYLRTDVPAVQVSPTPGDLDGTSWHPEGSLVLLQRRGDEFFLYSSPERRIWLLPRSRIEAMVFLGTCPVLSLPEQCGPGITHIGGEP